MWVSSKKFSIVDGNRIYLQLYAKFGPTRLHGFRAYSRQTDRHTYTASDTLLIMYKIKNTPIHWMNQIKLYHKVKTYTL